MKKNLLAFSPIVALALATSAPADLVPVSQDGWIGAQGGANGVVQDAGAGSRLNIATPNPSSASQYTRKAVFGFDVSSVNLALVTAATLDVTTAPDINGAYNGNNVIRFYLVSNSLANDSFDETTLTWNSANSAGWNTSGDVLAAQRTTGIILGDIAVPNPASSQLLSVPFSNDSLLDLANDSNKFLTIVAEYRGQNNTAYNNATGLGFLSKESGGGGGGAVLNLTVVPEPGTVSLISLGAIGLAALRRRRA